MTHVKDHQNFEKGFVPIWKKSKVDGKGRCVLPKKLRRELGLNGHSDILWICLSRKNGKLNEFLIELGVKK